MSEATILVQAAPRPGEDLVAVCLGLVVFLLALASLAGADALGRLATTSVWTDPATALAPVSKTHAGLGGAGALTAVLSARAYLLGEHVKRFAAAFTAVFAIAYACWFAGSWAYLATTADRAKFGVSWPLADQERCCLSSTGSRRSAEAARFRPS
jgi:hypothetical protein